MTSQNDYVIVPYPNRWVECENSLTGTKFLEFIEDVPNDRVELTTWDTIVISEEDFKNGDY